MIAMAWAIASAMASDSHSESGIDGIGNATGNENRMEVELPCPLPPTPLPPVVARSSHLEAVDARGEDDFDGYDPENENGWGGRHEVIRTGQRTPIPPHVRSAVWYRDRGMCAMCLDGQPAKPWELDHYLPWSAGGSDSTTNLRVLCQRHNQERSNWQDDIGRRPSRGATWWCINCYGLDDGWSYAGGMVLACPVHDDLRPCRVGAAAARFGNASWHKRQPIESAHTVAYCAHCDAPGMTDQVL